MVSEDAHTLPSDWQMHPEWWHAEDAQGTEEEVSELIGALVRAVQPEFVLETGSYRGQTAAWIGRALLRNGHGRCHSLEYRPERVEWARAAVAGLPVEIVCCRSEAYTPPELIGLAFLDTEQDERPGEVARYWDFFADHAIVAVHDTAPQHHADLAALSRGMRFLNLHNPRGTLIFQVER